MSTAFHRQRNHHKRKRIALWGFVAIITCNAGLAQTSLNALTRSDCEFIETYDRENETYTFASDFAHMAHNVEVSASGCRDCRSPLRKRQLDIEMSLVPAENMQYDAFLHAVTQVRLFIEGNTELSASVRPLQEPNLMNGGTIVFVFVDSNNRESLLDAFPDRPILSSVINTVTNPNVPCLLGLFEWTDASEPAFVFINAEFDNTPEKTASCVRQEAFNALGLRGDPQGDASLFSDEKWLGEVWPAPAFFAFGQRDELMIRLFYRSEFQPDQRYEETRAEITQIIASECS
ncbi:hypothetical protein [Cognatiyoonia sp. IB215182]|uniref:hypothetical protein n=1 Tax=Cognatiyoonia sp. IB215182 TaxID=3097353 RepID=UPI002A0B24A1|nr:hypothetical protein [Cognatiyoonia sp. IB215182]MDX8352015.1 hypothetical protein [Cognatiyoonia sp. IB215182]